MRQPGGLLQFPPLLEGIFNPCHCNLQTLHSYESSRLVLVCWANCSYANSAQMISIAVRSTPLVLTKHCMDVPIGFVELGIIF
jgi:hypothetical protein